jgi:hypothetical protein
MERFQIVAKLDKRIELLCDSTEKELHFSGINEPHETQYLLIIYVS